MDLYVILGLERGATPADVKRAYKRLARRYHPDINPGDHMAAAHFRQIAEAYETLSDPDRRRHYDATGTIASRSEEQTFGFEGFDFSVRVSGADASTFGDLFADVLFQRDARRRVADHRDAARALPHVQGTRTFECRGDALPAVSRQRHREIGARPHGVLEAVRGVQRIGASALRAVPDLHRPAGGGADRTAHD